MLIRGKSPLRISFAGGGTDVPPFPDDSGGYVLSCTIDKYAYCSISPRKDKKITISSVDFNIVKVLKTIAKIKYDGKLDLPKAVLKVLKYNSKGFDLIISTDAAPGTGLGSSSAVIVALIGTIKHLLNLSLSSYDIAKLAVKTEREELMIKGGLQDQYASTFGGFNFIEFKKNNETIVNQLRIPTEIRNELLSRLLLVNTNSARFSGDILERHMKLYQKNKNKILEILENTKSNAIEMKNALLKGDMESFGRLLEEGWQFKKQRDGKISNTRIDSIYKKAKETGAIGGKLLGAGGGGHILLLCDFEKKHKVKKKMIGLNCDVIPFSFETNGLQTWKISDKMKIET